MEKQTLEEIKEIKCLLGDICRIIMVGVGKLNTFEQMESIKRAEVLRAKDVLTVEEVAQYMGVGKSYIYQLTCANQIPYYKPLGKNIYFDKEEIKNFLKRGRVSTETEIQEEADKRLKEGK